MLSFEDVEIDDGIRNRYRGTSENGYVVSSAFVGIVIATVVYLTCDERTDRIVASLIELFLSPFFVAVYRWAENGTLSWIGFHAAISTAVACVFGIFSLLL